MIVFKAFLSSDHITPATGKTIAVTISKNGGGFANPNAGATNATEIASGWYKVTLDATDTATLGPLIVHGAEAAIDNVDRDYQVVLATPAVNVTHWAGSTTLVTNMTLVFNTDFATVYDTTNKAFLSKLGNFAMGGSSLALTLGAVGCTTITASGLVQLHSLTVQNATTLSGAVAFGSTFVVTGAITATNASNAIQGVILADSVTHGGSAAKLRLGSNSSTPALLVENTHAGDNSHAAWFKGTQGAGLVVDGGGSFLLLGAPGTGGFYAGGIEFNSLASAANLALVKAKTDNLPSDPADASDIAAAFSTVNSTLSTIAAYIDTEVAAIKAKTDNLPADPADASDIAASFTSIANTLSTIAAYIDTEVAAIKAKTDNLPSDPADQSAVEAAVTAAVTSIKGADGDTLKTLSDQIDGIGGGGGSGTGARTVTITVDDGTDPLQNAIVRMTEGVNTFTATTDADGECVFNLDDATYTVAVSKAGYSFAGTTLVVNGTETATYSMTAIVVTPGSGDATTGYLTCLNQSGIAESGAIVYCQTAEPPTSGTGFAYDSAIRSETSDVDGLVEFTGLIKGASYYIWRGGTKRPASLEAITISAGAGSTYALPSLVGIEA